MKGKFFKWENVILKGKLITIVPLNNLHEEQLKKFFSSDLFEYYPVTYSSCNDFISDALETKKNDCFFPWVFIDNNTQECVGSSSFASISFEHKRLELGWTWFGKEFHANGYNVESKLLLLEFLFEKEGFNRVELKTDSLNIKSNIAMQKLGFKQEGTFRNHIIMPSGRIRHSVYYSVICEEWPETKKIIQERFEKKMTLKVVGRDSCD
jgi:RimJ/RimL family protein N-acetyltransferase